MGEYQEKLKHLLRVSRLLADELPSLFPEKVRLADIWNGTVYLTVKNRSVSYIVSDYDKAILEVVKKYGISSVVNIATQIGMDEVSRYAQELSIANKISNNGIVGRLVGRLERLDKFNIRFSTIYGAPFPDDATITSIKSGIVTIVVRKSSYAARLRFDKNTIIETCINLGAYNATDIKIKVVPTIVHANTKKEKKENIEVSKSSVNAVDSVSKIVSDDSLSSALGRLAESLKKRLP